MARLLQLLRHAHGQALLGSGRAELRSALGPAQPLLLRLSPWPFTPGFASAAEPPDDTKPPAALGQSDSEEDAEGALFNEELSIVKSFSTLIMRMLHDCASCSPGRGC